VLQVNWETGVFQPGDKFAARAASGYAGDVGQVALGPGKV
jgi:hypothetical protein